jgi:hypothetical protein
LIILAAMTGAFVVAAPATAAPTITASPGAVQPSEVVLADTRDTATTVFGSTNQTNTSVSVSSLNGETLTSSTSNGQARFAPTDLSLDMGQISLTQGGTFTSAEFNLFSALAGTTSVSISVNGATGQTFALGQGENFFGIVATGTDVIRTIAFDTNGSGVTDLRQVRLGGVSTVGPVPEPGTWAMMLIGFGAMGAAMRRRRRTNNLLQIA